MRDCPECGGRGSYTCPTCNGLGEKRNPFYIIGFSELTKLASDWTKCSNCNGKKKKKCKRCHGEGRLNDDD